jgi:hypothetical protein
MERMIDIGRETAIKLRDICDTISNTLDDNISIRNTGFKSNANNCSIKLNSFTEIDSQKAFDELFSRYKKLIELSGED